MSESKVVGIVGLPDPEPYTAANICKMADAHGRMGDYDWSTIIEYEWGCVAFYVSGPCNGEVINGLREVIG